MIIISHRGNLYGSDPATENLPKHIDFVLSCGFDVEIDIWLVDQLFYLGHDSPQYLIDYSWLVDNHRHLWIHCKNCDVIHYFVSHRSPFNYFWHVDDDYTITSGGILWCHSKAVSCQNSVVVMPENQLNSNSPSRLICSTAHFAVCTDYPYIYKDSLQIPW